MVERTQGGGGVWVGGDWWGWSSPGSEGQTRTQNAPESNGVSSGPKMSAWHPHDGTAAARGPVWHGGSKTEGARALLRLPPTDHPPPPPPKKIPAFPAPTTPAPHPQDVGPRLVVHHQDRGG